MLSGNSSISHYTPSNIAVWMTMAFQAGLLNIGGFMACHQFISHVTGFATLFGLELFEMRYQHALGVLAVPLFFLLGSMLSGLLVDLRLKLHKKPKYYISFGVIFFLIIFTLIAGQSGFFGLFGEVAEKVKHYVLLANLCLVCGIQNGMVTSVSKSVIRTTHLTGVTTDLGIGIVRFLNRHKFPLESSDEIKANFMRIGIIFFFGLGSVVGAFGFYKFQYAGFILPALTSGALFATTLYFQRLKPLF